jgi:hypothetical protein
LYCFNNISSSRPGQSNSVMEYIRPDFLQKEKLGQQEEEE